jgi:2-methylcitrate dehydratase PrpD
VSPTLAERIAGFAREFELADVPGEVLEAARLHFLDVVGVGLAAATVPQNRGWATAAVSVGGVGRATGLGQGEGLSAAGAALLNGALIHSLEYDDTHTASIVHGGAVVAATALAVAEERGASGRELLRAFIAGWEVFIRLGLAAPGRFQAEGFQVTSVGGPLVAAMMAGMIARRDEATIAHAMGIAGSQASGIFEFLSSGASVKSLHPGWAAHGGIVADALAAGGMTGPPTILEGRFGFFRSFARDPAAPERLAGLLGDLGRTWRLPEAAFKAYPCCHYIHAFLEGAEALVAGAGGAERIAALHCSVPAEMAPLIAEPWPEKQRPRSGYDAKWSLPYCLAALLEDGAVTIETFSGEPRVALIARAARMSWEPSTESGFPARFAALVEARLVSGETVRHDVDDVRGGAARPFPRETVLEKFRDNACRVLQPDAAEEVLAIVASIEQAATLERLGRALRQSRFL